MSASRPFAPPPFDPELAAVLEVLSQQVPSSFTPEMIGQMRLMATSPPVDEVLAAWPGVVHREHVIPGYESADLVVSVFSRSDQTSPGPGFLFFHAGGMVSGDRFTGIDPMLDWVERFNGVCVSVEYRVAPEFPDPVPLEDCYAGLVWTVAQTELLGIDPTRLVIVGASAGGGLAAGATLLARDRGVSALLGQVLIYPMLDDRNDSVSSHQVDGLGWWDRTSNQTGWHALLGERRGTEDVTFYSAPGRATELSGLPPTFLDAGSVEVFRDEIVSYASTIWACGGIAELHVWPGGFHSFDLMAPHAELSRSMSAARTDWLRRLLKS